MSHSNLYACAAGVALAAAVVLPAAAQEGGFRLPVGFVEAKETSVRRAVELTGSVESRRQSLVASEVAGLVIELARREGDRVERGQALVRLRRDTAELRLRAAEGQLQEARAMLELARTNRQRAQQLFDEKVFSRQQLDDALSQFDASQGRVSELEAEVERLGNDVARTVVRAPFDAVVVEEHTAVGEWIGAGDPVAELVDVSDLEVRLDVPEQFFGGLAKGEAVRIELPALDNWEVEGTVRAVVPKADPQARTFPVKIALGDASGRAGVGMLARVRLPVGASRTGVVVPKDAIVTQGASRFVFLLSDDDRVRQVGVTLGTGADSWVAVEGEVRAGDRVVIQGNERLQPGQPVQPRLQEVDPP